MIIGLTGSIASGKSTVSEMLKKRGFPVVDADEIARLVVEPGTKVINDISLLFGQEILHEDGTLNRKRLGELVFGNEVEITKLNSIIHPAIRTEMLEQKDKWITKGFTTVIMDIPLLFESKLQHFVERIIVVSVTPEIQKARLMARNNLTEEEASARIRSQLPMVEKERGADAIIYNNGAVIESEKQLEKILNDWNIKL